MFSSSWLICLNYDKQDRYIFHFQTFYTPSTCALYANIANFGQKAGMRFWVWGEAGGTVWGCYCCSKQIETHWVISTPVLCFFLHTFLPPMPSLQFFCFSFCWGRRQHRVWIWWRFLPVFLLIIDKMLAQCATVTLFCLSFYCWFKFITDFDWADLYPPPPLNGSLGGYLEYNVISNLKLRFKTFFQWEKCALGFWAIQIKQTWLELTVCT